MPIPTVAKFWTAVLFSLFLLMGSGLVYIFTLRVT